MGIDRGLFDQIQRLLRPLTTQVANMVARAVVQRADDSLKKRILQLGILDDEDADDAEHFEPYGFTSVPLPGAEAVAVFPEGDRERALVVVVSDRRHRPTGGEPGQVTMHHYTGSKVTMLKNGNIEIQPGPGGEVLIRDEGGAVDRLVKKSEFDGHTHGPGTFSNSGGNVAGVSGGAAAVAGTQRLRVQ